MINMKKQFIMVIALLALVSMMIVPVSAETLTGSLGSTGIDSILGHLTQWGETDTTSTITYLRTNNIENTQNPFSYVRWMEINVDGFDAGAPPSAYTPVTFRLNTIAGAIIGTGTIGYQRTFNGATPPVETPNGFFYVTFNSWNITGLTGSKIIYLDYSRNALYNASMTWISQNTSALNIIGFAGTSEHAYPDNYFFNNGDFAFNRYSTVYCEYTVTKPAGLGIMGVVSKTSGGTSFNSRIFITNATDGIITSDTTSNPNTFNFTVINSQIKIKMLAPSGTWYNTSVLFTSAIPTVTPTPGPTIPAGYVRNNLYVWDQNDAQITGADVDVLDVENASWTNTTADADGWIIIDTLPYHTVNVYAHYPTAGIYLPNEILGLETGYYGGHNWVLVLYPYVTTPSGFVTLYINTRNYDTKAVLTGVNLQIKNLVTGATTGESTGSTDSVSTVVTNATNYQITGSKSGYLSKTININSGEGPSKIVILELSKATVTVVPTSTIPSGGVTPVITQDPNDPALHDGDTSLKAQEMMNWLAMNGMDLVQLCFLVTVLALLGVKLGK